MAKPIQVRWGFAVAYTLIVIAVTIGFVWQAQLIDDLHETQEQLLKVTVQQEKAIQAAEVINQQFTTQLCDLLLTIGEEIQKPTGIDLTDEIQRSFERVGIDCRPVVQP